jgi:hypothetical protein
MIPFQVDPSWYERYWLTERPARPRGMRLSTLINSVSRHIGRAVGLTPSGNGEPLAPDAFHG